MLRTNMLNFFNTNQFPSLQLFYPHKKPYGVRGFGKNYHMQFYPKLGGLSISP